MIFVETGTRGVYVIKFNGSGKITSDKQGEYEVTIEYKMFDCKIEYLCK